MERILLEEEFKAQTSEVKQGLPDKAIFTHSPLNEYGHIEPEPYNFRVYDVLSDN